MRRMIRGCLAAIALSALGAGAASAADGALRVVDRFSLPCKSVNNTTLFHKGTFVAMMDGCKFGVVQGALYARKYGAAGRAVEKVSLIFPKLLMDTPLDGNNQGRTWIDDDGGLNWLAPSRKLGCLAYSRLPDPAAAGDFYSGTTTCLEDDAGLGTGLPVFAGFVRLSNGDLFHHAGKRGVIFRKDGDGYTAVRAVDPEVTHIPSDMGETLSGVWGCAEGTPGQLLCQARFESGNPAFASKSGNDQTGLAVIDLETGRLTAVYKRGTIVFDRLAASPKGLLVSAAHDGPRQLAWTVLDASGRLIHDDKTDERGVLPISHGPEWGYGTPAFSPDGAFLYVFRSDRLLDVFATAPFARKATLSAAQLGIGGMGFVAVDKSSGRVAVCGDADCAIIEGWK